MDNRFEIVFVDDEETNLYLYKKNFKKHFSVKTFSDPYEAKFYLTNNSKALTVVTDQTMPKMKGVELAREVIASKEYMNFIMITGNPEEDKDLMRSILRKNFFFEMLLKPVKFSEDINYLINLLYTSSSYSWRNLIGTRPNVAREIFTDNYYNLEEYTNFLDLFKNIKAKDHQLRFFLLFDTFQINNLYTPVAKIKKVVNGSSTTSHQIFLNNNFEVPFSEHETLIDSIQVLKDNYISETV